jgi:hypothetical protein
MSEQERKSLYDSILTVDPIDRTKDQKSLIKTLTERK